MTPRKKHTPCSTCNDSRVLLQRNTLRLITAQNEVIKAKKMLRDVQIELALVKAQLQALKKMKWQEVILNLIECTEFLLSNGNYHQ